MHVRYLAQTALPPPVQAQAFGLGLIPYIPALGRDGTAEWLSQIPDT